MPAPDSEEKRLLLSTLFMAAEVNSTRDFQSDGDFDHRGRADRAVKRADALLERLTQ